MPTRTFRIREGQPLLDIVSLGRGGSRENAGRFSKEQVELIARTVQRTPEAVVKVLSRNSHEVNAARKHIDYIGRYGTLELEGDGGERLQGRVGQVLLDDWDLDIDEGRPQATLLGTKGRKQPKLVHKLMFSMPPGTPAAKVLDSVRNFAREEFCGQHRYAFVLHTDEAHPHVHLVLKAVSEQGVRLNIRKATLRHWRTDFARHLRLLGVAANATERAVRGAGRKSVKDGIYRAGLRGDSFYIRAQTVSAGALLKGNPLAEVGKKRLIETRRRVKAGWFSVRDMLISQGLPLLAKEVRRFADAIPHARTDKEQIADTLAQLAGSRLIDVTTGRLVSEEQFGARSAFLEKRIDGTV